MAIKIKKELHQHLPDIPIIGLLNKSDLTYEWKLGESELNEIEKLGISTIMTSAKTGRNVEEAFSALVKKMDIPSGRE